jgi:hypothetical protein
MSDIDLKQLRDVNAEQSTEQPAESTIDDRSISGDLEADSNKDEVRALS